MATIRQGGKLIILIDDEANYLLRGSRMTPAQYNEYLRFLERTLQDADQEAASNFVRDLLNRNPDEAAQDFGQMLLTSAYMYNKLFNDPLDYLIAALLDGTLNTYIKLPNASGKPEWNLPEGVEWGEGPCDADFGPPVYSNGTAGACLRWLPGSYPTVIDDTAISQALSNGEPVSVIAPWYNTLYEVWFCDNYGWLGNPSRIPVEWNSSVHGLHPAQDIFVPAWDHINDAVWLEPLNRLLEDYGLQPWTNVDDMLHSLEEFFGVPRWWESPPLIPVEDVPPVIDKPVSVVNPEQPPAIHPKTLLTVNGFTKVTNGFREKPGRRVKERKGAVEKGLWKALNVLGKVSEVEDFIKGMYHGLPKKLRGQLWYRNGKHELSAWHKLEAIVAHYDQMDWPKGLTWAFVMQADDLISAYAHQGAFMNHRTGSMRWVGRSAVNHALKDMYEDMPDKFKPMDPRLSTALVNAGFLEK